MPTGSVCYMKNLKYIRCKLVRKIFCELYLTVSQQCLCIIFLQRSLTPDRSPGSLFRRSQTKTRTVWSCCQTHRGCSSKPDPSDLLRSPRRCPTISWLETRSWSTSHHLDPSDLLGHRNISDRRSAAGRRPLVLATNRNGGMLQLNASRRDDDDEYLCCLHEICCLLTQKVLCLHNAGLKCFFLTVMSEC